MKIYDQLRFLYRAWRYRLRYEKFGVQFLLTRDLRGKTAVDVGSNWGIFSYWMHRKVGTTGRVIAFDAQPEMNDYLANVRETFRLRNLDITGMGLSSEPAQLILRRRKGLSQCASFHKHQGLAEDVEQIPVQVTSLDDHFRDNGSRPISFIKCDVEGHEYAVFRGGERILTEDRPDLLFECHYAEDPNNDIFSFLRGLDYQGFCFVGNGFAPVEQYRQLLPQMHKRGNKDFVFVPKERAHALRN